eukprot:RCo047334
MAEFDDNLYEVLGLTQDATDDQIKAAYRKLVLVKHPDKREDKEQAQIEFRQLQKAYEVLLDAQARKAFDDVLAAQRRRGSFAKAQRTSTAGWGAERQKMREKLEVAEREAAEGRRTKEDEVEVARRRLQQEIERLRRTRELERKARRGPAGSDGSS